MGKVKYATGIDHVSGSLAKPKVKEGHSCGTYLIGTHRNAPTTNPNCTRLFIREADTYKRTTPISALETKARSRFSAVSIAVKERAVDLSKMSQDQQAFEAQKNLADGKKTMRAYLWRSAAKRTDAEHNG